MRISNDGEIILNIEYWSWTVWSDQEKTFSSFGPDPNPIVLDQTILLTIGANVVLSGRILAKNFCTLLAMNGSVAKKHVRVFSCKANQEFI